MACRASGRTGTVRGVVPATPDRHASCFLDIDRRRGVGLSVTAPAAPGECYLFSSFFCRGVPGMSTPKEVMK
ncbi:MAG: hypothetical protein ACK559_26235, partial [bacterium]